MWFGLTNALTVSQALITDVLRHMLNEFYFNKDLQRLLEQLLFVKAEKC